MSKKLYHPISLFCTLILIMTLAITPQAQAPSIAFGDISGHWGKADIMAMCEGENPLFKGTGDVNGVPMFSPDKTMSGHEFITVICRAMYPNEMKATNPGEEWWAVGYRVATNHNLVSDDEKTLENGISRQKMAKIMAKVLEQKGEDTSKLVSGSKIPDFNTVGEFYQHDVRVVYSLGIIQGTDASGNFAPTMTVTRAQGATILRRLLDPSCRKSVDFSSSSGSIYAPVKEHQEWVEGQQHGIPKEGDVVIKADGTRVTLKETVFDNGVKVLGVGQGVDYVTGCVINGKTWKVGYGGFYSNDRTTFIKCERTGEVFTQAQWGEILDRLSPLETYGKDYVGDYDGEISCNYWEWSAEEYCWNYFGG